MPNSPIHPVPEGLTALRKAGLSVKGISVLEGIADSAVSKQLKGISPLTVLQLCKIAEGLKLRPQDLFDPAVAVYREIPPEFRDRRAQPSTEGTERRVNALRKALKERGPLHKPPEPVHRQPDLFAAGEETAVPLPRAS